MGEKGFPRATVMAPGADTRPQQSSPEPDVLPPAEATLGCMAVLGFELDDKSVSLSYLEEEFGFSNEALAANTALALLIVIRYEETRGHTNDILDAIIAEDIKLGHAILFNHMLRSVPDVPIETVRGKIRNFIEGKEDTLAICSYKVSIQDFIRISAEACLDDALSNEMFESGFESYEAPKSNYCLNHGLIRHLLDPSELKAAFHSRQSGKPKTGFRIPTLIRFMDEARRLGLPGSDKPLQ